MNKTNEVNQIIRQGVQQGSVIPKQISDGEHTFEELYDQMEVMFCSLCNLYPHISWKTTNPYDPKEEMPKDMFIAGIYTPMGQATYHIHQKLWDVLHVSELPREPEHDNMSEEDAVFRIYSMSEFVNKIERERSQKK